MMLIRCFLAPSKIEGIGLFARDAVAKGTEVYRFTPPFDLIVDTAAIGALPTAPQEFFRRFTFGHPTETEKILLEFDEGRYMNHAEAPNTDCSAVFSGFAVQDIAAGEELTCNYRHLDGGQIILEPPRWDGAVKPVESSTPHRR
ncbi:MAG: SET domain-containing protein-lysine N-methyltransferase [Proteobacteria bacterium]|nr:SET domain-containing protein-lysine N-methyltransferase [Pseudomonadota bacterium]